MTQAENVAADLVSATECVAADLAGKTKAAAECLAQTTRDAAAILRRESDTQIQGLKSRIDALAAGHATIVEEVKKNTEITERIATSTAGLVDAWNAISGGLKVLNFLGKVAKWVTYIAGMFTAVYAAWHFRDGPPL